MIFKEGMDKCEKSHFSHDKDQWLCFSGCLLSLTGGKPTSARQGIQKWLSDTLCWNAVTIASMGLTHWWRQVGDFFRFSESPHADWSVSDAGYLTLDRKTLSNDWWSKRNMTKARLDWMKLDWDDTWYWYSLRWYCVDKVLFPLRVILSSVISLGLSLEKSLSINAMWSSVMLPSHRHCIQAYNFIVFYKTSTMISTRAETATKERKHTLVSRCKFMTTNAKSIIFNIHK